MEDSSAAFGAYRGGIFADDMGLGKTVTSLALIVTTAGKTPLSPPPLWDEAKIDTYWIQQRGSFGNESIYLCWQFVELIRRRSFIYVPGRLLGSTLCALSVHRSGCKNLFDRLRQLIYDVEVVEHLSTRVEHFEAAG